MKIVSTEIPKLSDFKSMCSMLKSSNDWIMYFQSHSNSLYRFYEISISYSHITNRYVT